jgi:hypothetical protein
MHDPFPLRMGDDAMVTGIPSKSAIQALAEAPRAAESEVFADALLRKRPAAIGTF